MSLIEREKDETKAADVIPAWKNVTHRIGWILQAKVSPLSDLPPYDPDPKWTKAARAWSRPSSDEKRDSALALSIESGSRTGAPPFPVPEKDELVLGVVRAKRAAQIVMRNHQRYNDLVKNAITTKRGLVVQFREELPAVRFDPGLIVDLPAFTVLKGKTEIATGRLCLTVCMHESRSKIWTRLSSSNDGEWGDMPCAQLKGLVKRSREWFAQYAEEIRKVYESNIAEALEATGEKKETHVQLSVRNKVELISGDTALKGLGRLSAAMANEEDVCSDEESREAAEQLDAIVRCVPEMGLEKEGAKPILRPAPAALDAKQYYFVPHRTARGFRGIYIVRAHKEDLLFAGIAATDSDPYVTVERMGEPTRRIASSPSQHVTAELANTVAKYF